MKSLFKRSPASHVDLQRKIMFLAMFLLSFIFAIKTISYLLDQSYSRFLNISGLGIFGLFALTFVIALFWKMMFIPSNQRYLLETLDSFVMQTMNRACMFSWVGTLILLSFLLVTTDRESSMYPTEFYLNLVMFVMLISFSVSFFVLFGGDDHSSDFDETKDPLA